jgi:hypothetical protein
MSLADRREVADWIIRLIHLGYSDKDTIDQRLRAIFRVSVEQEAERAGNSSTSRVQNEIDWGWSYSQNPGRYVKHLEERRYALTGFGEERARRIARSQVTAETVEKRYQEWCRTKDG